MVALTVFVLCAVGVCFLGVSLMLANERIEKLESELDRPCPRCGYYHQPESEASDDE